MPPARRTRRSRRLAAGLALLAASAVLALAAACGGGGGGGSSDGNDDGSAAGNGQNGFAAYAECMNKNGVKLNLPSGGAFLRRSGRPVARPSGAPDGFPGGFPGGIRRSGGPGGGSFGRPAGVDDATWQKAQQACRSVMPSFGAGGQRNNPAFTAYRNCLGDHGVTLQGGRQDLNSADPKTAAAMKACEALRPTSRPTFRPTAVPSATT